MPPKTRKPAAPRTQAQKNAAAAKRAIAAAKPRKTLFIGSGTAQRTAFLLPGHAADLAKARGAKHTAAGKTRAPKGHTTMVNGNGTVHLVPHRYTKTAVAKARSLHGPLSGPGECPPTKAGTRQVKVAVMHTEGKKAGTTSMQCRAVKGDHGVGHTKVVKRVLKNGSIGTTYNVKTRATKYTAMGFPKGAVGSRGNVMSGRAHHTRGGLKKDDFIMTKAGKYVSKAASASAKARFFVAPTKLGKKSKFATIGEAQAAHAVRMAKFEEKKFQKKNGGGTSSTLEALQFAGVFGGGSTAQKKAEAAWRAEYKAAMYPGRIARNSKGATRYSTAHGQTFAWKK